MGNTASNTTSNTTSNNLVIKLQDKSIILLDKEKIKEKIPNSFFGTILNNCKDNAVITINNKNITLKCMEIVKKFIEDDLINLDQKTDYTEQAKYLNIDELMLCKYYYVHQLTTESKYTTYLELSEKTLAC